MMNDDEISGMTENFRDRLWRINHLYHIIDEQGQDAQFVCRPAQERFFRDLWYYNIVLKARQLGFTTLIDIIGLDMTIFTPNFTAVIIAETKEKAADIFRSKIVYPYEHLPVELRKWCRVTKQTADGEIAFSNGSVIRVMVSARSGTCQFLHVSEYGPVCARQPAKAEEIKTGSLPAVHKGGYVFIESTAMGNSGNFYEMVMAAHAKWLSGRKLGMQEYRLHFFPWWDNEEYQSSDPVAIPDRMSRYFSELEANNEIKLNERQKNWYVQQEQTYHETMWSEFPSYPLEAFRSAQDGSYYGRAFQEIYRTNRICAVPYDGNIPVYTGWDLGMSDETSIWFLQFFGKEVRVIDFYTNNGEGLPHYAEVLRNKGYKYARHFAPHDIAVRELSTGISRMETAKKYGIEFERIPTNLDLAGGIENCREMLAYCWFDDAKTESGRKCLEAYRKEFDEKHNCFKSQPLHDWASHGADAFRTICVAWKLGLCGGTQQTGNTKLKVTGGLRKL